VVTAELKIRKLEVLTFGMIGFDIEVSSSLKTVAPEFTHQLLFEFKKLLVAYAILVVGSPLYEL
jgi:hypothetical protein